MKLGIKCGLKSDYKTEIFQAQPDFVEVWFNAGKAADYQELFNFLTAQKVRFGLHFWGALPDNTLANIAYPNQKINQQSFALYLKTVEIAAKNKSLYVNLHPNGYRLTRVDFIKEQFTPYTKAAAKKVCLENLKQYLCKLGEFAKKQKVPIFVEAAPKLANGSPWTGPTGRLHPIYIGEIPINDLEGIFTLKNIYFANDFGHIGSCLINASRTQIIDFIHQTTVKYAAKTKLIHVGYLIPPFIGTDYHGSLTYKELETKAVPNKNEMIDLLRIFKHRKDVMILVEPESDHVGNFRQLQKLVAQL